MEQRQIVVHLVHGTWPRGFIRQFIPSLFLPHSKGKIWSQVGSPFAESIASHLEGATVRVQTFSWSGRNSQLAREHAALNFQRHLRSSVSDFPSALHYVVGHSHGGNVALLAVTDRKARLPESVRGVISLATPFLTFLPLRGSRLEKVLRLFPLITPPLAVALALALVILEGSAWLEAFLRGGLVSIFLAPAVLFVAALRRREIAKRYLRLRRRSSPKSAKLLAVLRAPGDEATLALALPQLVALWSRVTWRALVRPLLVAVEKLPRPALAVLLVVLPLVGLGILLAPSSLGQFKDLPPALQLFVTFSLSPIAILLTSFIILMPVAVFCGIAIGPEMLVAGFVQEVFVDAAPAGWRGASHWIMPGRRQKAAGGLRHSIHEMPEVRIQTAKVIQADIEAFERRRRQSDSPPVT